MDILIINLPSATKRKEFQKTQLSKLNLDYQFLEASSVDNIKQATYEKHYFDWQRPLRKVEVACYFSHRKAWDLVIKNNSPAVILEDDALVSNNLPKILECFDNKQNDYDFIQLEVRNRKKLISKKGIKLTDKYNLHRLFLDRTGAAAYILWPNGAKKLVRHEEKIGIGLADAHITSCYKLIGYQIEPAIAIQLDQCENYYIKPRAKTDSQILTQPKPIYKDKYKFYFKAKRIFWQLKMFFQQVKYSLIAKRRRILLDRTDFK